MADGDLCELGDVQAWVGNATSDAATGVLTRLITAASRAICNYCGRGSDGFEVAAYTDLYDGSGREFMLLRQWPVVSVESIALTDCGATTTTTDPSAFLLEQPLPSGGNQRLTLVGAYPRTFPRGRSNVQIAYSAGYETVPFDVAQACIEAVGEAYRRKERIGQVSVSMPNQSTVSFSQTDLNASAKLMLASYRRLIPC